MAGLEMPETTAAVSDCLSSDIQRSLQICRQDIYLGLGLQKSANKSPQALLSVRRNTRFAKCRSHQVKFLPVISDPEKLGRAAANFIWFEGVDEWRRTICTHVVSGAVLRTAKRAVFHPNSVPQRGRRRCRRRGRGQRCRV